MGELFDRYVVVDWSAASRPKQGTDSIWIATLDDDARTAAEGPDLANPSTRREAEAILRERCAAADSTRTLIAIDAPFGYPAGAAPHFEIEEEVATSDWRAMWHLVSDGYEDDATNANNRFDVAGRLNRRGGADEGPFWGRPSNREVAGLLPTKSRPFTRQVPEFRHCEGWLRSVGLRPMSCWQLMGVGSVGSQTLTLVPILERLLDGVDRVDVWPFTTGWRAPRLRRNGVALAETWPTAFPVADRIHWIRDASQVHDVAIEVRRADRSGELAGWFGPPAGLAADAGVVDAVERAEGWALVPPQ